MALDYFIHPPGVDPQQGSSLMLIQALLVDEMPDMRCHCSSHRWAGFSCCSHCCYVLDMRARQALTENAR